MYISTSWCKKLAVQQDPKPGIETSNHRDASGKMGWNGCMSQLDPWLVFSKMCFFTFLGCSWGDGFTTGKSTFFSKLTLYRSSSIWTTCFHEITAAFGTSTGELGRVMFHSILHRYEFGPTWLLGGFSGGLRRRTALHSYVSLLDITWSTARLTVGVVTKQPPVYGFQIRWSQWDVPWYSMIFLALSSLSSIGTSWTLTPCHEGCFPICCTLW